MACIARIRTICAMLPVFHIVTIQAFHPAFFRASFDKNKQKVYKWRIPYGDAPIYVLINWCILYGILHLYTL